MFLVLFHSVEKLWMSRCVKTFDWYCMYCILHNNGKFCWQQFVWMVFLYISLKFCCLPRCHIYEFTLIIKKKKNMEFFILWSPGASTVIYALEPSKYELSELYMWCTQLKIKYIVLSFLAKFYDKNWSLTENLKVYGHSWNNSEHRLFLVFLWRTMSPK